MAQRWRDETRGDGGNQRPAYWDQNEQNQRGEQRAGSQRDWPGEGGGWQGGGPGGEQGYYGREGDDARHGGQAGRAQRDQDWGADYGGGSQSASGWRANQSAFYGEEGGNTGRDMPYSQGGTGHRQQRGLGGSGQSGHEAGGYRPGGYGGYAAGGYGGRDYGAGGYGYERDWRQGQEGYGQEGYGQEGYGQEGYGQGEYGRQYGGGGGYRQGGARWGQFGGPGQGSPGEETWGPRSQRGMGAWRDQYGSGEGYGRGGGPAGQMDYGQGGYYGRDMRGEPMRSHRGKGPKGYERSAERLKEDICERLSDAHDVDASEISISVKDGIVTLEGSVDSRQMKHRAEDIVEACSGVKDVENRLKVQGQAGRQQGQQSGQQPEQPSHQGVTNQNRLTTGGPLHH